ncbi:TrgA family protein [Pseudorhodobacter sp. W20_MBD10_FR17]|uniref:TrgA family protein n=1 Tax=Pseudorhodobacter sp. W20_MBD10_FR17 TaxID=3240266 RepID=UPI003F94A081
MPTISKLIAAIWFGAVAFMAAQAFKLGMPEGTQYAQFNAICIVIGVISGWRVMGGLVGLGYQRAVGSGIRTSVTFTAWALLICSIVLMVRKAYRMRYGSPMEAIVDIVALAIEHGLLVFTVQVLSVLIIGGILGGLGAEWAKKRWE